MKIKQVSCFVENQPGRLESVLEALKAEKINIRALCVAETSEYGIMRMVLSDSAKGVEALRKAGFTVKETVVLQKEMPDQPGGLLDTVAKPLAKAGHQPGVLLRLHRPGTGDGQHSAEGKRPGQGREGHGARMERGS